MFTKICPLQDCMKNLPFTGLHEKFDKKINLYILRNVEIWKDGKMEKLKNVLWLYLLYIRMKKLVISIVALCYLFPVFSFAQNNNRGKYGGDPIQILDNVVSDANDEYKIQQTALDGANDKQ